MLCIFMIFSLKEKDLTLPVINVISHSHLFRIDGEKLDVAKNFHCVLFFGETCYRGNKYVWYSNATSTYTHTPFLQNLRVTFPYIVRSESLSENGI